MPGWSPAEADLVSGREGRRSDPAALRPVDRPLGDDPALLPHRMGLAHDRPPSSRGRGGRLTARRERGATDIRWDGRAIPEIVIPRPWCQSSPLAAAPSRADLPRRRPDRPRAGSARAGSRVGSEVAAASGAGPVGAGGLPGAGPAIPPGALPSPRAAVRVQEQGQGQAARQATVAAAQRLVDAPPGLAGGRCAGDRARVRRRPSAVGGAVGLGPGPDPLDGQEGQAPGVARPAPIGQQPRQRGARPAGRAGPCPAPSGRRATSRPPASRSAPSRAAAIGR